MENLFATETNSNQAIETTSNCTQNQVNGRDLLCLIFGIITPTMRKNMVIMQEYAQVNIVPLLESTQYYIDKFYTEIKPILDYIQQNIDQFYAKIKPIIEFIQQLLDSFNAIIEPTLKAILSYTSVFNANSEDKEILDKGYSSFIVDLTTPESPEVETSDILTYHPKADRVCFLQKIKENLIDFLFGSADIAAIINEITCDAFSGPWLIPLMLEVITSFIMFAAIHDYRP